MVSVFQISWWIRKKTIQKVRKVTGNLQNRVRRRI